MTIALAIVLLGAVHAQVVAGTVSSQVVHRVDPELPSGAEVSGDYEVSCKVLFSVGTDGLPEEVHVSGCGSPFYEAAESAARQWRFRPALSDGHPQAYKYSARLTFQRARTSRVSHTLSTPAAGSTPGSQIQILHKVDPLVSDELRARARAEGWTEIRCKVSIHVGADGAPTSAKVIEAPDYLRGALVEAALQWRFEPIVVEGQPTAFDYMWSNTWKEL